jgi:hypothetical protein
MTSIELALTCLVLAVEPPGARRPPPGWVVRSVPASRSEEWHCANLSKDEWAVSADQGKLEIATRSREADAVRLPFTPELAAGEAPNTFRGLTAVQPVSDGFLAGFNRGEFGGGLYWFNSDGTKHLRISAMSSSWFPENVVSIGQEGRAFYVFQGLAHLTTDRGRLLRVQQEPGRGWVATMLVDLGSAPAAVIEEISGAWLVATYDGLVRVTSRGTLQRLWRESSVGPLYPSSVVRASDGVVHIGMRAWVVRARALNPGPPIVELLAPTSCVGFAAGCRCLPSKGDGGAP